MSVPSQSVFISYTREDLAATRRIADALSAFEVEVWFDQDGLEGGDAWDQKIRRQIKECSLFIPIISAQTQVRREAYFRLEWKLAEERTHLMAEGTAFLVPIAIDDTTEENALVPESFRRAQWMRLPRGVPNTTFVERVTKLLEAQRRAHAPDRGAQAMSPPARPGRKWAWLAAGMVLVVAASIPFWPRKAGPAPAAAPLVDKSIAVLPFANRSSREEDQFFTDGIHDDLLSQISHIRAIKTISRTSVMAYRGTTKNLRTIGQELGVAAILEGGVQRSGDHVRINVQLIDARTDNHLWAETYDRELTAGNVFKIQSEISGSIATALRAVLSPDEQKQLDKRPTENLAALEAYFQARASNPGNTKEDYNKAMAHYERAIGLDPGFAPAYAGLAGLHLSQIFHGGLSVTEQVAKAAPLVAKALELDPQSSDAWAAEGELKAEQGANAEADTAYRRAIELNPNNASARMGYSLLLGWTFGKWQEALEMNAAARKLEPGEDAGLKQMAAEFLLNLGRVGEARTMLEEVVRDHPSYVQGYRSLGSLYQNLSLFDLALIVYRKGYALDPGGTVIPTQLAWLYERVGESEKAVEWNEQALRMAPDSELALMQHAWIEHARGRTAREKEYLEEAVNRRQTPHFALAQLREFDLKAGRPQDARARYAAVFPEMLEPAPPRITAANAMIAKDLALILIATGERKRADHLLNGALAVAAAVSNYSDLAQIQALRGEKSQALAALHSLVQVGGYDARLEARPEFDGLRNDPEFQANMDGIRAKLAEQRKRLRELEASGTLTPLP